MGRERKKRTRGKNTLAGEVIPITVNNDAFSFTCISKHQIGRFKYEQFITCTFVLLPVQHGLGNSSQEFTTRLFSMTKTSGTPDTHTWPWLLWLSGLSTSLQTEGSPVWFPVRAHAWVAGQVPSWGLARGNWSMYLSRIDVSLPLFLPTFPSLSKNK